MPEAVILIGLQATGKTTFYRERLSETHEHISRDVLKTKQRQADAIEACLAAGKSFVLDNTNPAVIDRAPIIALAKKAGFRVVGIYFRSVIDECATRNVSRPNAVPDVALGDAARRLALPSMEEGFDELRYVRIGPDGAFVVEDWRPAQEGYDPECMAYLQGMEIRRPEGFIVTDVDIPAVEIAMRSPFVKCHACGKIHTLQLDRHTAETMFAPPRLLVCSRCNTGHLEPVASGPRDAPQARIKTTHYDRRHIRKALIAYGFDSQDFSIVGLVPLVQGVPRLGTLILMRSEHPLTVVPIFTDVFPPSLEDAKQRVIDDLQFATGLFRGLARVAHWLPGETGTAYLTRMLETLPQSMDTADVDKIVPIALTVRVGESVKVIELNTCKTFGIDGWRMEAQADVTSIVISTAPGTGLTNGFRAPTGLEQITPRPIWLAICRELKLRPGDAPLDRSDPRLAAAVRRLDVKRAEFAVVEIPDGLAWAIQDFDGMETVIEVGRRWLPDGTCWLPKVGSTITGREIAVPSF